VLLGFGFLLLVFHQELLLVAFLFVGAVGVADLPALSGGRVRSVFFYGGGVYRLLLGQTVDDVTLVFEPF